MCVAHGASGGHAGHKRQENLAELSEALMNFSTTGEDICGYPWMSINAPGLIVKSSVFCSIEFRLCFYVAQTSRTEAYATSSEEKPPASDGERLSGELLGLTSGCDLRKEGVTVNISGEQS